MKRAILLLCVFTSTAWAACDSKALLAGARDAAQGTSNAAVRSALELCFSDASAKEHDRALAAYLLTLGDAADVLKPNEPHLAYLAESDSRLASLSNEAKLRVRRLVADNAYENAQFSDAEKAYRRLYDESSADLREYATTKLGWTYMNQNRPDLARAMWLQAHEARIRQGETAQPTWVHGWAQAFVEAGGHGDDAEAFCRLARTGPEAQEAIVQGLVDGVPVLGKADKLNRVGRALDVCPAIRAAWLEQLGERFGHTDRACILLATLPQGMALRDARKLVTACRARIQSKQDSAEKLPREARDAVASLTAEAAERGELFAMAEATGATERACGIAIDAFIERAKDADEGPLLLAPDTAAAACERAVRERSRYAGELAERLEEAAQSGVEAKLNDPRVFLVSRLLDTPTFREAFLPRLTAKPGRWRNTVYPAIAAERLRGIDNAQAQKLYDAYVDGPAAATVTATVWEALRTERVAKMLDEKQYDDALALLRRDAPAKSAEQRTLRLWLRALALAPEALLTKYASEVSLVATKALDSTDGTERLAGLELLGRAGRWKDAILALPKLAPKDDAPLFSDALLAGLFDAAVRGEIPAGTRCAPPELASLLEAARGIAAGKAPASRKASKRPLPEAVAKLATLDRLTTKASTSKGDATQIVSQWVDVLAYGQRTVEKTSWPHPRMGDVAKATLYGFCRGRAEALPKLKRPSQLSGAEWSAVTAELGKQLGACADAHGAGHPENGGSR